LPFWGYLFGPAGTGSFELNESWMIGHWRWPLLFLDSDSQVVLGLWFGLWVLATMALTLGYRTRVAAFLAWLLTMAFFSRNTNVKNGGDDIVQIGLFWLMFAPCSGVWALDARRGRAREFVAPWAVRLLQIQVCVMYTVTGLAKCRGGLHGTWLQGTSLHYVLNDLALVRWSYASFPVPFWLSAPLNYLALCWEVCFVPLVLHPFTRRYALYYGVLFHVLIYLTLEVGWFSFYSLALYPIWVSDMWWQERWPQHRQRGRARIAQWSRRLRSRLPSSVG
jgi:hypothetical protein